MKKLVVIALFNFSIVYAQKISVGSGSAKFSSGSHDAVTTTIYEASLDKVISEWKKELKDLKHEKVKDSGNEVFGDNILFKDWGNNPVDVYTVFDEDKKSHEIKMSVAVDLGGSYLTSSIDKSKHNDIEKKVKEFAINMTKKPISDQLKEEEKILKKRENELDKLKDKNKDLKEDIENYKKKIVKAEKESGEKKLELDKKKDEVTTQKKVVDASKDAVNEQAKSSKKIYDKLVDQQKDLEKDIKNLKEDVEDYNDKIKKAEKDIKENEEDQDKKKKEIEEQKKTVDTWNSKLDKVS